ncbi:hypothetical protein DXG01_003730 [Tephrocybe rancida]|nr:hypothetical protein DXG01_003730 [Tephrocybe rancida]
MGDDEGLFLAIKATKHTLRLSGRSRRIGRDGQSFTIRTANVQLALQPATDAATGSNPVNSAPSGGDEGEQCTAAVMVPIPLSSANGSVDTNQQPLPLHAIGELARSSNTEEGPILVTPDGQGDPITYKVISGPLESDIALNMSAQTTNVKVVMTVSIPGLGMWTSTLTNVEGRLKDPKQIPIAYPGILSGIVGLKFEGEYRNIMVYEYDFTVLAERELEVMSKVKNQRRVAAS